MPNTIVAIPVRDEAVLIGDCLRALALQQGDARPQIVLLVNNSGDGTAELVRGMQPTLPCPIHVVEHSFPPGQADAGHARRMAMEMAASLGDADSILLTTDADSCVAPDWLEANLAAMAAGADAVCGRAIIDPVDALAIPAHLHEDDAREVAYGTALDRMAALLDPDQADPWPRHAEESGASIAVRRGLFLQAGGVPAVKLGEDRALVAALRRVDARIRHCPAVCVTVSGRTEGRAALGMADTIRRRIQLQDALLDGSLEPAADRVRRVGARRLLRLAWDHVSRRPETARHLGLQLSLRPEQIEDWLAGPYFGGAWASIEAASPVLQRRAVLRSGLAVQMEAVQDVLMRLESLAATPERRLHVGSKARGAAPGPRQRPGL